MTRLVLNKLDQMRFFTEVREKLKLSSEQMGKLIGMSGRNYRDWINGKLLPKKDIAEKLSKLSGVKIPTIMEEREEWWSGRVNEKNGGDACYKKHGSPGTNEDRRKGWLATLDHKRRDSSVRWSLPSEFKKPDHSEELAEFIGIVLGDGGLTKDQCVITLHIIDDIDYSEYVRKLANRLFEANATIASYPKHTVIKVIISGIKFIEMLKSFGLFVGNKMSHKVDMPDWIKENIDYLRACMRGLYDTDGTAFTHKHSVLGHQYVHFGVGFCSASKPLYDSFAEGMRKFGIKPHFNETNIFCCGVKSSKKFFEVFRPNNPKYEKRLLEYLSSGGSCQSKVK